MDEQCLIRDHRAAIALNNMGVSMLERRAYRQGMETLKDAILVMKRVLRRSPSISSQSFGHTPNSTSDVDTKVHHASKRMANPQPIPSAVSVDIVSHCPTFSHHSYLGSVLHGGSSSAFRSPIRIEAAGLVSLEESDYLLESSIILFNFGLAHLCMAKLDNSIMHFNFGLAHLCMAKLDKTPIKRLQEGALKIFSMVYSILASLCNQEGHGIREEMILILAATLDNIVALLTQMGKHSEANESDQELARLGRAIQEFRGRNLMDQNVPASAA
jgi:hypothetical protein